MKSNFDHDILFEFLPEEDKESFMVWDNVLLTQSSQNIVATYRAPFEERVFIPFSEYDASVKQKERDNKLNNLVLC